MSKAQTTHTGDLDKAIGLVGCQARLARALGVTQQTVSHWRRAGVPVEYCARIELLTEGQVTRRDLRHNDWHLIWPELVVADQEASHG